MRLNILSIHSLGMLLVLHGATHAQQPFPGSVTTPAPPELSETPWMFGFDPILPGQEVVSVPLPGEMMRLDRSFRPSPLAFERNDGQFDSEAKFLARGPGYHLYLTATEVVTVLYEARRGDPFDLQQRPWWGEAPAEPGGKGWVSSAGVSPHRSEARADSAGTGGFPASHLLRMRLVGAKPSPSLRGEDELRGKVNYFIGNDPSQWCTNIATFSKVRYHDVYPGIDLVYYGNERQLEYDFIVAPGADAHELALAFDGADEVTLDDAGDLILRIGEQQLRWRKPLVYQQVQGARHEIAGAYRLDGRAAKQGSRTVKFVSFELAAYDRTQPLVIDPALVWGTFLGGSDISSYGMGIAIHSDGNAYIAGQTASVQFPTKNPLQPSLAGNTDAFVTKLDSAGQIVYSTYIGGTGNDYDFSHCLAVDSVGSAYVVGTTYSSNFPLVNALQTNFGGGIQFAADAFVLKLSPDGSALVYSTYLGGSDYEAANGIAVDSAGNAYVCGNTASGDFPTTNAIQSQYGGGPRDAFVTKLNPTGSALVYSTFLGGTDYDFALAIAVDDQGSACIGGYPASLDFPTQSGFQSGYGGGAWDGFLAKLSPSGDSLLFSSYFGGTSYDYVQAIAVGSNGDVYFAGLTGSGDLPTANAIQPGNQASGGSGGILANTTFVARYNPASNSLFFSTYLGGGVSDEANALALDADGNVYVGGQTASPDFPITADAFQASYAGGGGTLGLGHDAFLSVLIADGSKLIYSSYLGGSGEDRVSAVALDRDGKVYVTGETGSADFPVQNPIVPNPSTGQTAAFVLKFSPLVAPPPLIQITHSGSTVTISWPVAAAGFMLESTTSLSTTGNWSAVTNSITVNGDQNTVTLNVEGGAKFFRLKKL